MDNSINQTSKSSIMGNLVFLLLALPLGLIAFQITVIGLSVGLGTLVVWIGLPIVFVTLLIIRGMAEIERRMVSNLLRMPIAGQLPAQREPARGFLQRFGRILSDPYTWTSMIYMLLKLPLGIISFTVAITFLSLTASLILLPLVYLVNLFVNVILLANGVASSGILIPYFIQVHGSFEPLMFARSFVGVPLGIAFWFITRFLINALAQFSGEIARALLGPGVVYVVAQPHTDYTAPVQEQRVYAHDIARHM